MPKARRQNPKKRSKSIAIRVKYKIGGRKGVKSAQALSNEQLLEAISNPSRPRDKAKLVVLASRRGLKLG